MTVDTKDILLKAAEDVQSGMWCKALWFVGHNDEWDKSDEELYCSTFGVFANLTIEEMQNSERCAEGSLILATRLLGGDSHDYDAAIDATLHQLRESDRVCEWRKNQPYSNLFDFNDDLPDDPFEAGQQLAELFRKTAEAL